MSNTSVLESATREVTFRGESLVVSPLKVGQIPAFARAIKPMFAALAGAVASIPPEAGDGEGGELQLPIEDLFNLIADHGENMIEAMAIAVRLDKAKLQDADMDDFVSIVRAVVEVNADFFGRAMAKARAGAGTSLSSS